MFKRILSKLLRLPFCSRLFLRSILKLHSFCYNVAGGMAIQVENGVHPKHRIMRYKEWFLSNVTEGEVVLDVGSNTGMLPQLLGGKVSFVYGVEIEPKLVDIAIKNLKIKNVEFICADATKHDYSGCIEITCLTLSNVLEHIDRRKVFLEKIIGQVAWRPDCNKKILIRVPMINRDWVTLYKKEIGLEYRLDSTHFTEYTYETFYEELDSAGVQIDSYDVKFGEIYAICHVRVK